MPIRRQSRSRTRRDELAWQDPRTLEPPPIPRRGGLAGAGACRRRAGAREAAKPDPLITEVQDWKRYLGDGVDKRPYGTPSKFEKHVVRRDVSMADRLAGILGQLHAAARARRHHHAVGPVLRAPSRRHRRDRSGQSPADDPRAGRQAAGVHHGRHQAHAAREPRSTSSNARRIPAWSGAARSSTAASSRTAWSTTSCTPACR